MFQLKQPDMEKEKVFLKIKQGKKIFLITPWSLQVMP